FPHAVVDFPPMGDDKFPALPQHLLHLAIDLPLFPEEMGDGFHDFAVDIELVLFTGGISDSHWSRSGVTAQMFQLAFLRRPLAVDIVQDPQLRASESRRV